MLFGIPSLTTATSILKLPSITWLDIANNYISDAAEIDITKFQYLNVMPQHVRTIKRNHIISNMYCISMFLFVRIINNVCIMYDLMLCVCCYRLFLMDVLLQQILPLL